MIFNKICFKLRKMRKELLNLDMSFICPVSVSLFFQFFEMWYFVAHIYHFIYFFPASLISSHITFSLKFLQSFNYCTYFFTKYIYVINFDTKNVKLCGLYMELIVFLLKKKVGYLRSTPEIRLATSESNNIIYSEHSGVLQKYFLW